MPHTMLRQRLTDRQAPGHIRARIHGHAARLMLALAAVAVLATLLAGCGGTAPGAYNCTAPQNPYGCATQLAFTPSHQNPDGNPDIPFDPVFVSSNLLVVPLSCDASCQASSGTGNPPGFIENYVELWDHNANSFLAAGYTTTPSGMQYFVRYVMPGVNNGQYDYATFGPAPTGDGGNTINYKYAGIMLGRVDQTSQLANAGDWIVIIFPPYGSASSLSTDLGPSTFHPDTVYFGQLVYGAKGASAQVAYFADNNIFTSGLGSGLSFISPVTEDGEITSATKTADHPTDAAWFIKATQSSTGGMFRISCC